MSGSLVPHQISLRVRLAPGVPLSNHHHMFHSHLQRAYTHLTVYIFIFCRFVFPHGASSLPACFPSLWTLNGVDWWRRAICSIETVVLGGTHQKYDYNKRTCPFDAKFIYDGCVAKVAALKKCQVVEEWVGLRPGRKTVRLDCDQLVTGLYKSKVFSFFFLLLLMLFVLGWRCIQTHKNTHLGLVAVECALCISVKIRSVSVWFSHFAIRTFRHVLEWRSRDGFLVCFFFSVCVSCLFW